ncbi:ribonuclease H-like domain-containing protein [Tanacetum coccineum]
MSSEEPAPQMAPVESPQMIYTVKLPMLKKGEYTLWSMRMEQYITNTDYGLWQVIMNGDEPVQTTKDENGVETEVPPKTAQALLQRQKERKAKIILLLSIPDEYQLRFHTIKDAKSLWAAIKSRFGGNVESKKMQKNVLKQQFENFSEDANQKFLRAIDELDIDDLYNNLRVFEADIKGSSGSSSNLQNVDFLSAEDTNSNNESSGPQLDDEYLKQLDHDNLLNVLTVIEEAILPGNDNALIVQDGLGYDRSYITQDEPPEFALMAYTSNTSGSDTEANLEIVAYQLGLESVEAQLVVHQKNEVVYEEKIAVLEFEVNDKGNVVTRLTNQLEQTLKEKEDLKAKLEQFETSSKNLTKLINSQISSKDKTGLGYGDQLNEKNSSDSGLFNSVFDSHSSDGDDNQTNDKFKKDNKYHAVPPPLTRNYIPPLADLSFAGLDDSVYRPTTNKTSASVSQVETNLCSDDDEDIFQSNDLQAMDKPSFKRIEFTNARNESVKPKQAEKPRIITQNPKVDRRDWNGRMTQKLRLGFEFTKKACFICGSYSHLIKDYDFHEKGMAKKSILKNMEKNTGQREIRPVWNSAQRINDQNKFVPSEVLTRIGRVPVSAAKQSSPRATTSTSTFRPVNTATHTNRVNVSKLRTNAFHKSHSSIRRSFYKSAALNIRILNEKVNIFRVNGVNTAGQIVVSTVKGNGVTTVKASAGCVWRPKMTDLKNFSKDNSGSWVSKRVNYIDPQGRLKHMTGNKDFLIDYQDIDGGFVAFGGSARGGKITGKGKIRTYKLDFEDVFFVKELKFNLFYVSQMCDKKNSVLFTETECLVLSLDFKLLDASQVLLRVPRQSNMYSFDLKNVVPSGDLTCLFAKAIIDESKLWHRRLGHVNFKTMNKLVKGNLVRGLPSKIFENDHTCVACQKGKQHKASFAERKNMTLIEAARTMLADSLLPTVFWAEAVNTACYVLNRVLVTKPHNKTPYELIIGRPPSISFMRPFGCSVTILNTLDPLGKFDGKAKEGFLVGYSVNSKAFRVFNSQTRKVEENLHVNFLENKPNVAGQGPNWLFDIDSLTNSMNYQPVTTGNQSNKNAGPQETNGNTDETDEDGTADDAAGEKTVQKPSSENQQTLKNVLDKMMDQEKEAKEQSDTIRKEFEA